MADDEMVDAWDLVKVRVPRSALPVFDFLAPNPEPFGPSAAKPVVSSAGRIISMTAYPQVAGPPGIKTKFSICVETADTCHHVSIDEHSARFLLGGMATYLRPFQPLGEIGTPNADAAKPSFSSHAPAEILAAAVSGLV